MTLMGNYRSTINTGKNACATRDLFRIRVEEFEDQCDAKAAAM
jgi:hypothetical protein